MVDDSSRFDENHYITGSGLSPVRALAPDGPCPALPAVLYSKDKHMFVWIQVISWLTV